jgi:hypothetical protein
VKALKPFSATNCVAHRFNNVVKLCFFQMNKKKVKKNKNIPSQILEIIYSSDSENDTDEDEVDKGDGKDVEHSKSGEYITSSREKRSFCEVAFEHNY